MRSTAKVCSFPFIVFVCCFACTCSHHSAFSCASEKTARWIAAVARSWFLCWWSCEANGQDTSLGQSSSRREIHCQIGQSHQHVTALTKYACRSSQWQLCASQNPSYKSLIIEFCFFFSAITSLLSVCFVFLLVVPQVDPLVSLMRVEKVPDATYDMVGGLDQQIKEIKEVRACMFSFHPSSGRLMSLCFSSFAAGDRVAHQTSRAFRKSWHCSAEGPSVIFFDEGALLFLDFRPFCRACSFFLLLGSYLSPSCFFLAFQGVLLYGPPGTGKTLLARAVAHHTECCFIRVSGSELVQKYIGEGSRMVRELFVMARFVACPSLSTRGSSCEKPRAIPTQTQALSHTQKVGTHTVMWRIRWKRLKTLYPSLFFSSLSSSSQTKLIPREVWTQYSFILTLMFCLLCRQHAPSIIFMDEIDSIGGTRIDSGSGSGDSEVQRTMLELLNQLDGFEPTQNIKVLMATNRIDILDPALLRPGRIDRKIEFPNPDEKVRSWLRDCFDFFLGFASWSHLFRPFCVPCRLYLFLFCLPFLSLCLSLSCLRLVPKFCEFTVGVWTWCEESTWPKSHNRWQVLRELNSRSVFLSVLFSLVSVHLCLLSSLSIAFDPLSWPLFAVCLSSIPFHLLLFVFFFSGCMYRSWYVCTAWTSHSCHTRRLRACSRQSHEERYGQGNVTGSILEIKGTKERTSCSFWFMVLDSWRLTWLTDFLPCLLPSLDWIRMIAVMCFVSSDASPRLCLCHSSTTRIKSFLSNTTTTMCSGLQWKSIKNKSQINEQ